MTATTFERPQEISDVDVVFPADVSRLMPPYEDIPDEFRRFRGTKWNRLVSRWFYRGLPSGTQFIAHPDIDSDAALRHLRAIIGSFQPKHEHKDAACAYLMSLWFDDVVDAKGTSLLE